MEVKINSLKGEVCFALSSLLVSAWRLGKNIHLIKRTKYEEQGISKKLNIEGKGQQRKRKNNKLGFGVDNL